MAEVVHDTGEHSAGARNAIISCGGKDDTLDMNMVGDKMSAMKCSVL